MVLAWPGHGAGERNSRQGYTVCVAQSISLKKGVLNLRCPKCLVNPKSGSYKQFTLWEGWHKGQMENIQLENTQKVEISAAECVLNKIVKAIFESSKPKLCSTR